MKEDYQLELSPYVSFSLEKNGVSIFSNEDVHYHKSTFQITKISSHIYKFTIYVYLQQTHDSKALSDTRVIRYKVIWRSKPMGELINERVDYDKELSEFLLLARHLHNQKSGVQ